VSLGHHHAPAVTDCATGATFSASEHHISVTRGSLCNPQPMETLGVRLWSYCTTALSRPGYSRATIGKNHNRSHVWNCNMPDLAAGTVTFLFTDIEESTATGSGTGRRCRRPVRASSAHPRCVPGVNPFSAVSLQLSSFVIRSNYAAKAYMFRKKQAILVDSYLPWMADSAYEFKGCSQLPI